MPGGHNMLIAYGGGVGAYKKISIAGLLDLVNNMHALSHWDIGTWAGRLIV